MFGNQGSVRLVDLMQARAVRFVVMSLSWGAGIFAMLSLRHLHFAQGHTFCGPWGCGGRTEDLVAAHAAWCVALISPVVILVPKRTPARSWHTRFGVVVLCLATVGVASVVLHTWLVWLPAATEYQRGFIWHRVGFAVLNMVDVPLIQMMLAGSLVLLMKLRVRLKEPSVTPVVLDM